MKNYLEKLEKVLSRYENVTILGHDNFDVDSVLAGIMLSNLLTFLGIKNKFAIQEEVKENETFSLIKEILGINIKKYQSTTENELRILFIEDHYCSKQKGKVVACLDHHPTSDKIVDSYEFYYYRDSCSTSFLVYELMLAAGYKLSTLEAKMLIVSMMVDTVSFRSEKTIEAEKQEAKMLADIFGFDYAEIEKKCLCITPIEKFSVERIAKNGLKFYNYKGHIVKSSYVQLDGLEKAEVDTWLQQILKYASAEKLAMWVFIIFDCKCNKTIEYRITSQKTEKIEYEGILSRGANIMPNIEKYFSKN